MKQRNRFHRNESFGQTTKTTTIFIFIYLFFVVCVKNKTIKNAVHLI